MTLVEHLAKGWSQNHAEQALEFTHRWGEKFQADAAINQVGDNCLRFTTDLSRIRLHGMADVHCLLVGGDGAALADVLCDFKHRFGNSSGAPFLLAASEAAYNQALKLLPAGKCLSLPPSQLEHLLSTNQPEAMLKQCLREQIPLRRLIPYTHLLSVEGEMFFGRRNELDRLDNDVSFAVAGPGRIGKTSLVKQYQRKMLQDRDPQWSRSFYIDLYHCSKEPNIVARFMAMKLEGSRRSSEVTSNKLQDFLQYQRSKLGGKIHLLLDEVDHVCQSEAFNILGEAAKLGFCRLILIGKGELLKMMLYSDSQLKQRLQLLQLNPLDEHDARNLLLEPLADLGLEVDDADQLVEEIFHLTGRLPHLMQFFARKLVELAFAEGRTLISVSQVEALKWDFETAQFFISPLQDQYLEDPQVRLIAFLLLKEQPHEITPAQVRGLARHCGLSIDELDALKICNELVIHNVLVWNKGGYHIANRALVDYAQQLGILDGALESARLAVR